MLWGANNEYFEIIKKQYPKLKLVARGNELKALGDKAELQTFHLKFQEILHHIDKFQNLNGNDLLHLFGSTEVQKDEAGADKGSGSEPIVFGPNGIVVKARYSVCHWPCRNR